LPINGQYTDWKNFAGYIDYSCTKMANYSFKYFPYYPFLQSFPDKSPHPG